MKYALILCLLLAGCAEMPQPRPDTSADTEFICITDSAQAQ
jgi:starvation-inducible outer membrane lipoprotein